MDEQTLYQRQWDIVKPSDLTVAIHIVGVGGIGSWAALLLAKMGCSDITVFDPDMVELHNTAYQFYSILNDVENKERKVEALRLSIGMYAAQDLKTYPFKYEEVTSKSIPKYLIIGVDSMQARHDIADCIEHLDEFTVIDGRMGGDQVEIYVTTNKEWRKTLVRPGEEDIDPCSARSVVYNTAFIGSVICNTVKKLVKGQSVPARLLFDLKNWDIIKHYQAVVS